MRQAITNEPPDLAGKQPASRRSAAGATDWRSLSHTPDCMICLQQPIKKASADRAGPAI
jgi:hypothetical protein